MKSFAQQQAVSNKANLIKYLNPSALIQTKSHRTRSQLTSNIHCRSMQDLQLHLSGPSQQAKQNPKSTMHHSSLYNDKQNINKNEQVQPKSRSLSKFITFFENSSLMGQVKKEVNENRRKNYNGFCYDLKVGGNSTVGGNNNNGSNSNNSNNQRKVMRKKDKQNINYQTVTATTSATHRQPSSTLQTRPPPPLLPTKHAHHTSNLSQQIEQVFKLRQTLQNYKQRETIYNEKISQLHQREQHLCQCVQQLQQEKEQMEGRLVEYQARIRQLEVRNKQTIEKHRVYREQKTGRKESREQTMVIKSLKKVINQQLTKIIQLQRVKIQNQYLREKLGRNNNDESFSESGFSNNQGDYSFQYEHKGGRGESGASTVRSVVDCQFGMDVFKKTKPLKNQLMKANEKDSHHHSSSRHFKSFFQVQQSPVSSLDGNIMNLFKPYQSRKKSGQSADEPSRQQNGMIKISQPESSFTRQAIQEVNEDDNELSEHKAQNRSHSFDEEQEEEDLSLREESDSILEEVDEYLAKWRNNQ